MFGRSVGGESLVYPHGTWGPSEIVLTPFYGINMGHGGKRQGRRIGLPSVLLELFVDVLSKSPFIPL
jgi:hypothetical protein